MKKYTIPLVGVLIFTGLISCDEDEVLTVTSENSASLLEADITTIELDRDNPGNPALTLYWSNARYSEQTPSNYQVEASGDESFADSATGTTIMGGNSVTFSVSEFNSLAAAAGLPPFEWNTIYLRIRSFLGEAPGQVLSTSNVVSLDIYTYYNYPVSDFYLVGPASASDWNNNNNNAIMFRNADDTDVFNYTGRFNSGPLKILERRGAWAPQYGEGDSGVLVYRPTEDDDDPNPINDLESLDAGYYQFSVDIGNLSFSITPFDTSASDNFSSLTISGSALASEATLTQYDIGGEVFDEFIWYIPNVRMVPGEFTFTVNGSDQWGGTSLFSGKASQGGGSIPVDVEDDYEVWFNVLTEEYQLIPINLSQS